MNKSTKSFIKGMLFIVIAFTLLEIGRTVALKRALISDVVVINQLETRNANEYFFVNSFKDLKEELELVNEENKTGVFVFFEMQGCPYCEYMKDKILNQIDVQEYYQQHFRSIIIDINAKTEATDVDGTEMTEAEFALKQGATLTPTMIFFGTDGGELYRQVGFLKTKKQFLDMAKEIVEITNPE